MKLYLKQFDITLNQNFDYNRDSDEINKRIERRLNQINNLLRLVKNNYSSKDYYKIVNCVYDIELNNEYIIRTNVITKDNLSIILTVNSDNDIDTKKYYDSKSIMNLFKSKIVLLKSVNIIETNKNDNNRLITDEELRDLFNYYVIKLDNSNLLNSSLRSGIKKELTNKKIEYDLNYLMHLTDMEMQFISNKTRGLSI